ncbi:hypothetical protein EDB19DRAFT_1872027, partial [Suillus lakei]
MWLLSHMTMTTPIFIFPVQTPDYILIFQISSWYLIFASNSIKSTIIRPLDEDFKEHIDSDGIFIPEGSK